MRRLILGLFLGLAWTVSADASNFYVRSSSSSPWVASTAYALGNRVVATTAATAAKQALVFECTTAGTSHTTEPAWNETVGGTTTDNTVTWTTRQATTWANAHAFLARLLGNASGGVTSSAIVWVSDAHAETQAAAITLTFPATVGLRILSGDDVAEPPTTLTTTSTITTTGNTGITLGAGYAYIYGINFSSGTGASGAADLFIGSGTSTSALVCQSCTFTIPSTSTSAPFNIGRGTTVGIDSLVTLLSPVFKFGADQTINLRGTHGHLINMSLDITGSTPTTLFTVSALEGNFLIEDSDLSGEAFTNLVNVADNAGSNVTVRNCKLPASINVTTGTNPGPGGPVVKMHNCDSADTNYRFAEHRYEGSIVNETTIVRTSGASDGTTPISWKMASSANTKFWLPLESPEIVQWNETTGSALTVCAEFIHDSVTNVQNDEFWIEVDSLSTSGFPKGTRTSDRMTDILSTPADQGDSSETWTTTGLTNPNTQQACVSVTPQEKGYLHVRGMLAVPSKTMYLDGKVSVQ